MTNNEVIAMYCDAFLTYYQHRSMQEHTERTLKNLRKALDMRMLYDDQVSGGITTAVPIERMSVEEIKALKVMLNRLLYLAVVREQELTPPPLGVSVAETINADDRTK